MTTVVVVGSGIAGLTAALHAHENGCRVTVVTKGALADTNTRWAQGGIAAVTHPADTVASHAADTTTAGAGLNDDDAVEILVAAGPARIAELVARGVAFDRGADGDFARGLEAAHAVPRVLHAGGDATGAAIQAALGDAVRAAGIPVREHALLADLVVVDGRVGGIRLADGELLAADAVILATGGAGQLYAHTTNPLGATGDGIAAAIRAGAAVADLEFVQFHPTALAVGAPFLVSEAVRGEGATLIDDAGRRFALDAHPDGELAPRDVVARANARAMAAQGGRPVRLDATALGAARLAERFPTIDVAVRERGLDWAREPIPVTPAAHYLMGGVVTDLDGRTTLPGLYAVGETARTGVHGANRLASNSLLEGAVFGARAGEAVANDRAWPVMPSATPIPAVTAAIDAPPFSRAALQRLMWDAAGLVRDADGLAHAAGVLAAWIDGVGAGSGGVAAGVGATKPVSDAVTPEARAAASKDRGVTSEPGAANTATRAVEDANLLLVATHVVAAARARTGSVGAHFRSDAPDVAAQGATASLASAAPASAATGLRTSAAPVLPASAAPAAPASIPAPQEALAC